VNTERRRIEVSGIPIELVRKDIKNLHVGVYPPNGRVRVAAPLRLSDSAVRLAVVTRLGWIRRQQRSFAQQDRQSEREMVSGETHYVLGKRYRLVIVESTDKTGIRLRPNHKLELTVRPAWGCQRRELMLMQWYRSLLQARLPRLIETWEPKVGVKVQQWAIRRMKTRWGTCNQKAARILFNLELAKKSEACLELIVVHELVHLLERHHNDAFRSYMDRLLPHWRTVRDHLNSAPLGAERWDY